jgi:hypothetical protein
MHQLCFGAGQREGMGGFIVTVQSVTGQNQHVHIIHGCPPTTSGIKMSAIWATGFSFLAARFFQISNESL